MYFRILILFFVASCFLSCEPEADPITYQNKYGKGTYILTDNGLNFIKKNV